MTQSKCLSFLTDQNVPEGVVRVFVDRGHLVQRVRDIMPANSPDQVVATAAVKGSLILVSWDRDFNHQRFMRPRFSTLSRIGMSCPEINGAARVTQVMDLIEFAFLRASGNPLHVRISADKFQATC